MDKHYLSWIIGISLCIIAPAVMFSVFGPNPLTLLFVCTISGAAMIYSIKLEASALKEKKIDVSQGSKTGNALAKWLGIIMLLVIVLPILLRVFGVL